MARTTPRPQPTTSFVLPPLARHCSQCGEPMWAAYHNYRTVTTLANVLRRTLQIRRCANPACPQVGTPYRPEEEGRLALPKHEFGRDVIALVGTLRYAQHRSVPESHHEFERRRIVIAPRTVLHLLERYDELLALSLPDTARLQRLPAAQGQVMLALDGLQPEVGHAVLWVLRNASPAWCSSRAACSRRPTRTWQPFARRCGSPYGCLSWGPSDGQLSLRRAVAQAFPKLPHQLGHLHSLREAAKPIYALTVMPSRH